jgi:hypothetical protein
MEDDTCVATTRRGWSCKREPLPDAPFPLCIKHAAEVLEFVNRYVAQDQSVASALRTMEAFAGHGPESNVLMPSTKGPWVYYLRVGDHIKIGYTVNLPSRLRQYPPNTRLLAYEPGDRTLERRRHRQFWHALRFGMEWFAPTVDLLVHIEQLNRPSVC